jgi:serine/threonine-protein kinase RIO1
MLKEFIKLCRKFSKAKIYHNDMRPWNILWNGKKCVFIDFEYSSKYDQDTSNYPQILYFFAIANYIKKLDQLKIWDIEYIIQQNSEYLHSNEAHKLFYTSWEKISAVSLSELLKIDYFDVKKGFKQLLELLESY